MSNTQSRGGMIGLREAVGVFHDVGSLQAAIDELQSSGFDRAELSLLASDEAVSAKLGHHYRKVAALEDEPQVPRTAYVSMESIGDAKGGLIGGLVYAGALLAGGVAVVSGGTLAGAYLVAALTGSAAGMVGSALARLIDHHHADYLQQQMERGGLLLWVRTRDPERERRATSILARHSASDVHLHELTVEQYLAANPQAGDLERALLDPMLVFQAPVQVVQRADLTHAQKVMILRRWAYDSRQLDVAEGEGMGGGEPDLLDSVNAALRALGSSPTER